MLDDITPATFAALTVDAPALKRALAIAGLVIEKRNAIHILAAVRATVSPGALTIAATDLDIQLCVTLPADTTDHATAVFNPFGIAAAVSKVKGKAAILFDGESLIFEAGGATLESNDGFAASDFPNMVPALYQDRCTLPASVLLAGLLATLPAVSSEAGRYYLNGVFFHGLQTRQDAPATLRLVSTDGHRLARYDLPADWPSACASDYRAGLIVPRKTCEVLARLLKDAGDSLVSIATDHNHATKILFECEGWRIQSKVIDGTYPDYTRVMPSSAPVMSFMLAAADIPKAPAGKYAIAVKLDADSVRMSWIFDGNVTSRDRLAEGKGATGFNARYLADFAKIAPDGLTIEASGSGDPARVTTSDSRFMGVIIPMRV